MNWPLNNKPVNLLFLFFTNWNSLFSYHYLGDCVFTFEFAISLKKFALLKCSLFCNVVKNFSLVCWSWIQRVTSCSLECLSSCPFVMSMSNIFYTLKLESKTWSLLQTAVQAGPVTGLISCKIERCIQCCIQTLTLLYETSSNNTITTLLLKQHKAVRVC